MGLTKKTAVFANPATATTNTPENIPVKTESGTAAAIERLQKKEPIAKGQAQVNYPKARDFDAEARGKTRCVMFAAALQSPAIAGLPFKTIEDFLKLVEQAAENGVKYSFKD
jgi:hypothetical protein